MKNNYEMSDVLELGEARSHIRGMKEMDIVCDDVLGCGWRSLPTDVDESDE
jgi:hypothetical protein